MDAVPRDDYRPIVDPILTVGPSFRRWSLALGAVVLWAIGAWIWQLVHGLGATNLGRGAVPAAGAGCAGAFAGVWAPARVASAVTNATPANTSIARVKCFIAILRGKSPLRRSPAEQDARGRDQ